MPFEMFCPYCIIAGYMDSDVDLSYKTNQQNSMCKNICNDE